MPPFRSVGHRIVVCISLLAVTLRWTFRHSKWSNDSDDIADGHNSDDDLDDEREPGDAMDLTVVHMEVDTDSDGKSDI